jgi:uncharacterized protein
LTANHLFVIHGQWIFLFSAAFLAGSLNSVAGGGSFISFPALLFTGMAPIAANATSTAALWPGTLASTFAYRRELVGETRKIIVPLVISAFVGGLLGAQILLHTPQATFLRLVPWLLLSATLLFLASDRIALWIRTRSERPGGSRFMKIGVPILQLFVGVYIGYFGAGSGIMILALLSFLGVTNIHAMNGMKTLLVSVGNAVAIVTFIVARIIIWPQALIMLAGASLGGYGGAFFAQKINPRYVRRIVICVGFILSFYFFVRR